MRRPFISGRFLGTFLGTFLPSRFTCTSRFVRVTSNNVGGVLSDWLLFLFFIPSFHSLFIDNFLCFVAHNLDCAALIVLEVRLVGTVIHTDVVLAVIETTVETLRVAVCVVVEHDVLSVLVIVLHRE